jgi:hypothetical protein
MFVTGTRMCAPGTFCARRRRRLSGIRRDGNRGPRVVRGEAGRRRSAARCGGRPSPATPAAPADPASPGGSSGTGGANSGNEGGAGSGAGGETRGGNGNHRGSGDGSTPARSHGPRRPAWLSAGDQPYSAALYDPYGNGEDEHASAAPKAVDGRAGTSWTTATHPDGLGKPGVGLVVEASGYQSYSAIGIQTATPGIDVAIYSTDASDPPQGGPDQPGWKLEATKPSIKGQQRIALKGATADPHYLIVWITKLAQGKPRASLSEISLVP